MKKIRQLDKKNFINYLYKIGYSRNLKFQKLDMLKF